MNQKEMHESYAMVCQIVHMIAILLVPDNGQFMSSLLCHQIAHCIACAVCFYSPPAYLLFRAMLVIAASRPILF
jgi:hypothetical protein